MLKSRKIQNVAPATFKHRKPQSFRCTYYKDGIQCPKVFGSYRKRDEHFAKHNQSASPTWYFCWIQISVYSYRKLILN
eukprot:UN10067